MEVVNKKAKNTPCNCNRNYRSQCQELAVTKSGLINIKFLLASGKNVSCKFQLNGRAIKCIALLPSVAICSETFSWIIFVNIFINENFSSCFGKLFTQLLQLSNEAIKYKIGSYVKSLVLAEKFSINFIYLRIFFMNYLYFLRKRTFWRNFT